MRRSLPAVPSRTVGSWSSIVGLMSTEDQHQHQHNRLTVFVARHNTRSTAAAFTMALAKKAYPKATLKKIIKAHSNRNIKKGADVSVRDSSA